MSSIKIVRTPISDGSADQLSLHLERALGDLKALTDAGERVYLHCNAGLNRAPTVAIAFMRAYRAMGNFRGDAQFSTWLHRIAVNTAKNHLVSQNRRPPADDIEVGDAEQFDTGIRLRNNDTPEHELLRQEIERTVMRVVDALPEELRSAISLREVEGLSYGEIATRMDCPIGTVRSRIFRAREAIDAELKPLLDNDDTRERAHK